MRALILSTVIFLSACSGLPSFYDDNESLLSVQVRHQVEKLNCDAPDVQPLKDSVDMLSLYSESKRSSDIGELIVLMKETTNGLYQKEQISEPYCNLKKKVLQKQSSDIASAIMRRY
jgi:hypothetical protein